MYEAMYISLFSNRQEISKFKLFYQDRISKLSKLKVLLLA